MKPKSFYIITCLILLFSSFPYNSYAQDFWEQIPIPDTIKIHSFSVNAQGHIFLGCGSHNSSGGIYRTTNEGLDWHFLGFENKTIYSLEIDKSSNIYAGLRLGPWFAGLYRSVDNGATWDSIVGDIGLMGNVVDIFAEGDTIFASIWGNEGYLIRSIDNGQNWTPVFSTGSGSEVVTDIVKKYPEELYISLKGFYPNMGGVYKSTDAGDTWEYIGLRKCMVSSLAFNSSNDLIAGVRGGDLDSIVPGIYALRNGSQEWEILNVEAFVNDLVVNQQDDIIASLSFPVGVVISTDNGAYFEYINSGLPPGEIKNLFVDQQGYLYASNSTTLAKSANQFVLVLENIDGLNYHVYPNPTNKYLNVRIDNFTGICNVYEVKIFDAMGRKKFCSEFNKAVQMINIESLNPGFYMIEIISCEKKFITKIIII